MTSRRHGRAALGGWLLGVAVAIAVLHTSGRGLLAPPALTAPGSWSAWLAERDPVVAAFSLLRVVTVAAAWYLLVMSILGAVLRLLRAGRLVAVADRVTIPALRRLLVATAGLSLASGIAPTVALAVGPQPPAAVAGAPHHPATVAGQPLPDDTTTTTDARPAPTLTMRLLPANGQPPAVPSVAPRPAAVAEAVAEPAVPASWTVRPGDSFWSIAEDVLTRAWGRAVTDAEIVPYWHTLIEVNRSELADRANPDLIYPAQVFTVPGPPASVG